MIEQRCGHCFGSGWAYASVWLDTGTHPEPQQVQCEHCQGTGHNFKEIPNQSRDSEK